jgi:hypothetical protein
MNTVPKGTNRPAAAARSRKHAQRTQLPPRPGQVEAAKAPVPGTKEFHDAQIAAGMDRKRDRRRAEDAKATTVSEDLARMTVPQLRQLARDRGLSSLAKITRKPELLAVLSKALTMKADQVAQRTARTLAGEMPRPTQDRGAKPQTSVSGTRVTPAPEGPAGTKSAAKARAFSADAIKLDWTADFHIRDASMDHIAVVAKRGTETIDIEWVSGVFQGTCLYSFDGRSVKLNNASAAKKRMARPVEEAAEEVARASANRIIRKSAPAPKTRALPFTEASLDQEVIDAVEGRKITWLNSISGEEEHDYVPAPRQGKGARPTHTKITEGKRGRTLTFVGMGGFHDVLVSSIVAVTR